MSLLKDKVAVVSGAGLGIGRAIAISYALEGAKVAVADINEENAVETVKLIENNGGQAFALKADSSKANENKRLVEEVVAKYGRLDIACNNAGMGGPAKPTAEYATKGIRCNAVGPGYIETPLLSDNMDEEALKAIAAKSPINRLGTAQEVADLVVFLSSDKSSFTTGSYIISDGGYTAI